MTSKEVADMAEQCRQEDEASNEEVDHGSRAPKDTTDFAVAKKESFAVWLLRVLVLFVFLAVACAVCVVVYVELKNGEEEDFEKDYFAVAMTMAEGFNTLQQQRTMATKNLAMTITADIQVNGSWPFMDIPSFPYKTRNAVMMGDYTSIGIVKRVEEHQREEWEKYVVSDKAWYKETVSATKGVPVDEVDESELYMPPTIVKVSPNGYIPEDNPGPYFPLRELYMVTKAHVYNMNFRSHPGYAKTVEWMMEHKKPALGLTYDFLDPVKAANDPRREFFYEVLDTYLEFGTPYLDDPVCPLLYPILDRLDDDENAEVVGFLIPGVYWRSYLQKVLPSNAEPILVILENTCNQQYTYRVDGEEGVFVGYGDLHNPKYDSHVVVAEDDGSGLLGSIEDAAEGNCIYSVRIYPTESFEDSYRTNRPLIFSLSLAAVFIFSSSFFFLYDYFVNRRYKAVEHSARRSHDIVSSLFPENVRDRLYEEHDVATNTRNAFAVSDKSKKEPRENAIATLYPKCTVLFADIVGFTKWSSDRSPIQVFDLLETIYEAFDAIALRLGVTKIETIGDCYVAVAGLPEPREDHAAAMVKFADRCHTELIDLVHRELSGRLGEDTKDLTMRFGLHSGPVTAGVLRGQKSRFQMFGDTVNTASRMESTGLPDHIHVSAETAALLEPSVAKGKFCVTPREELVSAKGKGELQTYWVSVVSNAMSSTSHSAKPSPDDSSSVLGGQTYFSNDCVTKD